MKVLAVYGTKFGQTEAVVRRIVAQLEAAGHTVDVHKGDELPAGITPESYGAALVASSIIVGKYHGYIVDFVRRNLSALSGMPSAFVSVSGTALESSPEWRAEAEGHVSDLMAQTGWQPRWTATFAGALRFPRYNMLTRLIMKRISRSHGGPTDTSKEYEFTDWNAVDEFGRTLAGALADQRAAEPQTTTSPNA